MRLIQTNLPNENNIYKIWSQLLTKRLSEIIHTITSTQQYGYITSLSTADAIMKLEAHLTKTTPETHIVLTGLTKAFEKVNRTLLWTTLYKKEIPIEMITRIRRGNKNTTLVPRLKNKYGKPTENNVGVFQGSAISAILPIIYQNDAMEDCDALNRASKIPIKHTEERTLKEVDQKASNVIRNEFEQLDKDAKHKFIPQLHIGQNLFTKTNEKTSQN